jgi:hypothetical protein
MCGSITDTTTEGKSEITNAHKTLITIPQEETNWKLRRNYKLSRWTSYGEAAECPDQTVSGMTG